MLTTTWERPQYAIDSLNQRLASIKGSHLTQSISEITSHLMDILRGQARIATNPAETTIPFWRYEGNPAIIQALENELVLARFKAALEHENFAYVANGHKVSPNFYHIYHTDKSSPTGRRAAFSAPKDGAVGEAALALLQAKRGEMRLSGSYTHDYR